MDKRIRIDTSYLLWSGYSRQDLPLLEWYVVVVTETSNDNVKTEIRYRRLLVDPSMAIYSIRRTQSTEGIYAHFLYRRLKN